MQQRLAKRARGSLSRGALISLLLHFNLVAPLVIAAWVYGGREEAQKAEEVDVAFQAADQTALPDNLPPIEPTPETPDPLEKSTPEKEKLEEAGDQAARAGEKEGDQEKKPPEPAKPEPEVAIPPPQAAAPPPPPPPERKAHEKMVDLDNDKDVPPPPDAKFLAQKNNRVAVETRARGHQPAEEPAGAASGVREVPAPGRSPRARRTRRSRSSTSRSRCWAAARPR